MHDNHDHDNHHDHDHHDHSDHDRFDRHDYVPGQNKEKPVLAYMLQHNEQHTKDLLSLADKIEAKSNPKAATLLREAARDYQSGNQNYKPPCRN